MNTSPEVDRPALLAAAAEKWKNPPAESVHQLPRKAKRRDGTEYTIHLDYMGHAEITLALIDVDPCYQYGWSTLENGEMNVHIAGGNYVLDGWLELHGVRRPCVATVATVKYVSNGKEVGPSDPEKELIGDLLRNGAMRFGIATGLWSKSDATEAKAEVEHTERETATAPDESNVAVMAAIKAVTGNERDALKEWVVAAGFSWPITMRHLLNDPGWTEQLADHLGVGS